MIFSIPKVVTNYVNEKCLKHEKIMALSYLEKWRECLFNISWFMRCFNEYIARKANKEDDCKGHFWEGRFKSQALLDEAALIQCMAHLDLNPIRAKIAQRPETSDYTSLQQRMIEYKLITSPKHINYTVPLQQFAECETKNTQSNDLSFNSHNYLQLVDWLGRCVRSNKRGAIPENLAPFFQWLHIDHDNFTRSMKLQRPTAQAIGRHNAMQSYLQNSNQKWVKNRPDWI